MEGRIRMNKKRQQKYMEKQEPDGEERRGEGGEVEEGKGTGRTQRVASRL